MIERRQEYDPALLLTRAGLVFVGAIILFVGIIIATQVIVKGAATTESWAALTGLIGWVTGTVGQLYNNRFGTTKQSNAKDEVIAQQSRTAAVIAGAAVPTQPEKPDAQT